MPNRNGPYIPKATIKRYGAGVEAAGAEYQPGDFLLTHSDTFFGALIRFGQYLRFRGTNRPYGYWNHTVLIIDANGTIVEAVGAGVVQGNIKKYKDTDYHLVHLEDTQAAGEDRIQAAEFGIWSKGEQYGWLTIVSIAISLVFGLKISFGFDGQTICSGLVARALERTNIIFDRTPSHITPADLAKYFKVQNDERAKATPRPRRSSWTV